MKKKGKKVKCQLVVVTNKCGRGGGCEVTVLPTGIIKERLDEIQD